jgi:hypothetical protein
MEHLLVLVPERERLIALDQFGCVLTISPCSANAVLAVVHGRPS